MARVLHNIPPLYDDASRVLLLGSFPSVKSREGAFFYHHPQNRFWRVLAALFERPVPLSIEEKSALLHEQHIALWDVAASCEVEGSADSSLRGVLPNDISLILEAAPIRAIFTNGAAASALYARCCYPTTRRTAVRLPSTSPANAAWSLEKLVDAWRAVTDALNMP